MDHLKLYYFPTSFFSQKALLALYEKEANFREQPILIHDGEQNEPWYLRVNPKGTVPALEVGDRVLTDSEDIVEFLDRELDTGIKLIPDPQAKIGQDVQKWRELFNSIQIGVLTYGILFNPELSVSGLKMPGFFKRRLQKAKATMEEGGKLLQAKADKYPDLRDAYQAKYKAHSDRMSKMTDRNVVCQILDDLDKVFDDIENKLADTREEQGVSDSWLVGPRFTMADVYLTILLDRLALLGMEGRYFPLTTRPLVHNYNTRIGTRTSVLKVRKHIRRIPFMLMKRFLKKAIPVTVGVAALAVGIAYWRK